ncbi:hypothetical protein CapIbe_017926 [Capra ibex]
MTQPTGSYQSFSLATRPQRARGKAAWATAHQGSLPGRSTVRRHSKQTCRGPWSTPAAPGAWPVGEEGRIATW